MLAAAFCERFAWPSSCFSAPGSACGIGIGSDDACVYRGRSGKKKQLHVPPTFLFVCTYQHVLRLWTVARGEWIIFPSSVSPSGSISKDAYTAKPFVLAWDSTAPCQYSNLQTEDLSTNNVVHPIPRSAFTWAAPNLYQKHLPHFSPNCLPFSVFSSCSRMGNLTLASWAILTTHGLWFCSLAVEMSSFWAM